MADDKKTYIMQAEGWVSGQHYVKDAEISMTEDQATYYVLGGVLVAKPAPKATPAKPEKT